MKYQATIDFGIIGLGRFGSALAASLAKEGKEVIVLDANERKIKDIQEEVTQALMVESLDKLTLLEAGIQNCETVIVCVGENIQASIITTLNLLELQIPRVIAKAVSEEHGRVLATLGAEVIYPEKEQALRLSQILTHSRAIDRIELSDEFSISEFKLTAAFAGIRIADADFRGRYGLNIIAIIDAVTTIVEIDPEDILHADMHIVVVGKKENLKIFERDLMQ